MCARTVSSTPHKGIATLVRSFESGGEGIESSTSHSTLSFSHRLVGPFCQVAKISLFPRVSQDDELLMRRMESLESMGEGAAHSTNKQKVT